MWPLLWLPDRLDLHWRLFLIFAWYSLSCQWWCHNPASRYLLLFPCGLDLLITPGCSVHVLWTLWRDQCHMNTTNVEFLVFDFGVDECGVQWNDVYGRKLKHVTDYDNMCVAERFINIQCLLNEFVKACYQVRRHHANIIDLQHLGSINVPYNFFLLVWYDLGGSYGVNMMI